MAGTTESLEHVHGPMRFPERSRDKYADHHERFVNDLRLDLSPARGQ